MPSLEQRVQFAETYWTNKEGRPFSLAKRPWVREEFWGPADGFKLWARDVNALCDPCRREAGLIITAWTPTHRSQSAEHQASGCKGIDLHAVIMAVLNLPRREGKTFNGLAYCGSTIFQEQNKSITYVASAGDQTEQLIEENLLRPIRNNPALNKAARIVGNKIYVPSTRSFLEVVPTSHGSITGRGRSHVVIDESRDVAARVAMALIPSVFANNGRDCPCGRTQAPLEEGPERCSVCGGRLIPWFGRIILMSSSGVLEGGEKDWFAQLVDQLTEHPDPNSHLFRLNHSLNPDVAQESKGMIERVFGALEATRTYVEVEVNNTFRRKGDDFVTSGQIAGVVDHSLSNAEESTRRCVAFLDTSISRELTSLVIVGEDLDDVDEAAKVAPWERLVVERIDAWTPADLEGGVIDPEEIEEHLDSWLPRFPRLVSLRVDVRVMPWAAKLVARCKSKRTAWAKKIDGFKGGRAERDSSWGLLEQRILARTIRLPQHEGLISELRAVRRHERPDGVEIRDRSRKKRHADVAEGLAACCYLAHLEAVAGRRSLKDLDRPSEVLKRLYRPPVPRMGPDSF